MNDEEALDPLQEASYRLIYAAETVSRLIPYIDPGDRLDLFVRNALLEAWYTNLRLIAEFLLGTSNKSVVQARDYIENWKIEDQEARAAIGRIYNQASEYVSHVGRGATSTNVVEVSAASLRGRASEVMVAFDAFALHPNHVATYGSAFRMASDFRRYLNVGQAH